MRSCFPSTLGGARCLLQRRPRPIHATRVLLQGSTPPLCFPRRHMLNMQYGGDSAGALFLPGFLFLWTAWTFYHVKKNKNKWHHCKRKSGWMRGCCSCLEQEGEISMGPAGCSQSWSNLACNPSAMWPYRKERLWLLGRHRHTTVAKGMPACRDGEECWGLVVFWLVGEELDKFNATVSPTWSNGAGVRGEWVHICARDKAGGGGEGCEWESVPVMDVRLMQTGLT